VRFTTGSNHATDPNKRHNKFSKTDIS